MIDTTKPDPQVYISAARKAETGLPVQEAILSSIEELHPEVKESSQFQLGIFNWRWEHVNQFRLAFGEIEHKPIGNLKKKKIVHVPEPVYKARNLVVANSLNLMAELCQPKNLSV
jgi:hypothetical protein